MTNDLKQHIRVSADRSLPHADRSTAFGEVVANYQDMAFGYALGLLGERHLAEDAAQEGFIAAWQQIESLRKPDSFPAWLRRIIKWQCFRFKRRNNHHFVPMEDDIEAADESPLDRAARRDMSEKVRAAVEALPETLREVTVLRYIGDYSAPEIAHFMGLKAGTVRKRLFEARSKLKPSLLRTLSSELNGHAPSANGIFGDRIMHWIRPDFTSEQGHFMDGRPNKVWDMLLAAVEGDLARIRSLLREDPGLANCNWAYYQPLHFAVREGHTEAVRLLLEHGADPSSASGLDYHVPPLERARDRGYDEIAGLLTDAIASRYSAQPVGERACEVVRRGNLEEARALFEASRELINASDERGNRPLHEAVAEHNLEMTALLLDMGAEPDPVRWDGCKPLHVAVFRARKSRGGLDPLLTGYLIARGANYSMTVACALGDERRVRNLLARDRNLANDQDSCGHSPLFSAAGQGYTDIVQLLLDHGADPNAPEHNAPRGHALYEAVAGNHLDTAKLLLNHGADPNAPVESSGVPLSQALGQGKNEEMINLLYRHGATADISMYVLLDDIPVVGELLGADPDLANYGGDYGVLCMAAGFARREIIEMLIRAGAELNRPWYANNYMGYAFRRRKGWHLDGRALTPNDDILDMLNLFFDHGADPNNANWHGVTYLHKLAAIGDVAKSALLLDRGASIEAVDDEWRSTPLGWAARWGHRDLAVFLLERGADPRGGGAEWATPLARAEKAGHPDIVELLK
ncbi:MAG: sigma-70 family RNA polymerase sigma factor [Gemmatimonadetes bacterium]|nr:sigma-70 family RNA polymerase sigma factor [Gemmatimonadota bacterium]MYG16620.1 sigma-70 family RNA polymerase sigma factor [Gemmatimonadota bacterium]